MKDNERKHVTALDVSIDLRLLGHVMRRQLPRQLRWRFAFDVREWEGQPWLVVYNRNPNRAWSIYQHDNIVASAPLINKPRRCKGLFVTHATIDPELLGYLLIVG